MQKKCLVILSTLLFNLNGDDHFNQIWSESQKIYKQLTNISEKCNGLATNFWADGRNKLSNLLLGKANINFLKNDFVSQTMVKTGYGLNEKIEECFLKFCLSSKTRNLIAEYKEADSTITTRDSKQFNCSSSTLQHLCYVATILEHIKRFENLTIVEFGGGYGNVARIFMSIIPNIRYFIIDLPETLTLQYLFLRSTAPQININVVSNEDFLKNVSNLDSGVYLVPINLHSTIKTSDVFLSTFAITEAPPVIQKEIASHKFYNAQFVYLTGQLNGWRESGFNWIESHEFLIDEVRKQYSDVFCLPYHFFRENLMSFELFAKIRNTSNLVPKKEVIILQN